MCSDDHKIKRYDSFESAVHFCLNFMVNSACDAPETLRTIGYRILSKQCLEGKSKVSSIVNIVLLFESDSEKQRFCVIVEASKDMDSRELQNIITCVFGHHR